MPSVVPALRAVRALLLAALLAFPAASVVAQEPGSGELRSSPSPAPPAASPGAPAASAHRPEGAWWVTAYDASGGGLTPSRPQVPYSLVFLADSRLEGDVGCGTLFGGYFLEGEQLSIGVVSRGQRSCGPRRVAGAADLTAALDAVRSWRAAATGLELLDEAGTVRVLLEPRTVLRPAGAWILERVARPDGRLIAGLDDGSAGIDLHEDGSLDGATGCRLLEGEWWSEIGRITIVVLDTTGLPCEGRPRRIERLLLAALDGVTHWRRDGDMLILSDADQRPLVELRELPAADAPAPAAPPSPSPAAST